MQINFYLGINLRKKMLPYKILVIGEGKVKVHPRIGHEYPEE
jgi:hypothetical protein